MNEINVMCKSTLFGKEVDVYGTTEEPLFLAKDVATWIEHTDVSTMMRTVDEDEKVSLTNPNNACGGQNAWFLTEDGLYEVLMQSRKPIAKQFKKGVKTILHEIRTKGGYITATAQDTPEVIMARALKIADDTIRRNEQRVRELEEKTAAQACEIDSKNKEIVSLSTAITEMRPKVSYVDMVLQCRDTVQTTIIAQDYGMSAKAFNILLRNMRVQRKVGTTWVVYGKYLQCGYVQSKTFTYQHKDGTTGARTYMEWTQKGRLFLYETLKSRNILPLIEQANV